MRRCAGAAAVRVGTRRGPVTTRAVLVGVLAAGLLVPSSSRGQTRAPWFGTWQLISSPSIGRFETPPYKRVTSRIEPWQDGLKVTYDMVRTRGGVTHIEWTGRFDGNDYIVQGVDYFLTNAYRQLDDRSYEIVIKVDGQVAATATAVVSPDGATLTVSTIERAAHGQTTKTIAIYQKQ